MMINIQENSQSSVLRITNHRLPRFADTSAFYGRLHSFRAPIHITVASLINLYSLIAFII
jgi:hypothetical protein